MNGKTRKTIRVIAWIILILSITGLAVIKLGDMRDRKTQEKLNELKDAEMLSDYASLYEENIDTAGWLKIEGTEIDYVVMHAPDTFEKYLRTDFYGYPSRRGCLYVSESCDIQTSDNVIIFGHCMNDGSMFGTLAYYESEDFYREHKYISFDTIYEKHTYEVVAAIRTSIPPENEDCFRYYNYTGKDDTEMFLDYCDFIEENRLYETDCALEDGDRILTLSTCAYHSPDGRFLVVAKQIA